jgi:outer membrane protein OmpA-like peptidoglycan-associated protein
MKKYIIYSALFFLPYLAYSQSTNIGTAFHSTIKKGDIYFNHYAYRNALNLYLHAYDKDPRNVYVQDQIADCYFKLHDPVSAAKWFSRIINEPDLHPESKFEYAESLSMTGNYSESLHWFKQYLKEHPDHKVTKDKIAFLEHVDDYLMDSLRFVVTGVNFNTNHSEYGVHYFHEGLVFASSRDLDWYLKHSPFDAVDVEESLLNMFYVKGKTHGEHDVVEPLHKEHIKSVLHEGPMAFYKNDTRAAYTRTNIKNGKPVYDKNGKSHLQIFFADVETLSSMKNITPFEYNSNDYSVAHPTLSPDGSTMYFSSTAPGGIGGSDLYVSNYVNGKWSVPVNLGPEINSGGEESFPFLFNDSTLYFSSNGHGSLGGLDILVSYKTNGKFGKPVNFGGPLNSRYDDFSLVCDASGRVGYIASNRPGGLGLDDIYYFIATNYFLTGKVVTYGKPDELIPGATVEAVDWNTGEVIDADISDNNGVYRLRLPFDKSYKIMVKKDGYAQMEKQDFSTFNKTMGMDSVDIAMWKHNLFAKGNIYSNELQQPLKGVTVKIYDLTELKTDSLVLDEVSQYNLPIWPNRKYRIEFSKVEYLPSEIELDTKGQLKGGTIINDILMLQESIANTIIHFDYNKSFISEESVKLMKPLVTVLKKFPKSTLNIGAHADSRGTNVYNQKLSDDRAKATLNYFVSQGISRSRITAKGFGETLLLTRCSDGEHCEEVEHAIERRAEIKVQVKKNR